VGKVGGDEYHGVMGVWERSEGRGDVGGECWVMGVGG
jgi:hypothetical protein